MAMCMDEESTSSAIYDKVAKQDQAGHALQVGA
jgi:hypothetical protein